MPLTLPAKHGEFAIGAPGGTHGPLCQHRKITWTIVTPHNLGEAIFTKEYMKTFLLSLPDKLEEDIKGAFPNLLDE